MKYLALVILPTNARHVVISSTISIMVGHITNAPYTVKQTQKRQIGD